MERQRILTRDWSFRRRLLWVGDIIDDDPVLLQTISEKIKAVIKLPPVQTSVWVGDIIDDDPVLLRTISEKIEAAIKLPDAAGGRD
ncbi:hypothetical protein H4Q26_005296 [Puccinia striiformis f. sp. tritici PST-130]|nr:hypothetical protein H4Q26_005296 [Puccinia striiformis f. sp. tritici PST-130]